MITFETENASTTLTGGISIVDNVSTQFDQGDNATPFLKVIETGAGEYTSLSGVYRYVDAFGSTPGDTDFGVDLGAVNVNTPTLEDVFLKLTGRSLRE